MVHFKRPLQSYSSTFIPTVEYVLVTIDQKMSKIDQHLEQHFYHFVTFYSKYSAKLILAGNSCMINEKF